MLDAFTMEEYIDMIWPYMLRHGVNWQPSGTYLSEENELIDRGTAEEGFQYDINDKSKNKFSNFEAVCLRWMDFSAMGAERREAA